MKTQTVYGYVNGMFCNSPGAFPAYSVNLDDLQHPDGPKPNLKIHEIETNRELVWVSLLRDAFVHSLQVQVQYEVESKQILDVFIVAGTLSIKVKKDPIRITGEVHSISIYEFDSFTGALREGEIDYAEIGLSTPEKEETLSLLLRTHNKEITLTELDMLRKAFEDHTKVHVTYYKSRLWREGKMIQTNVIVGVGANRRVTG